MTMQAPSPSGTRPRVVLAYSGGLDTTCILRWLIDKGFEVIAFVGDVGQDEDFEAVRAKAQQIGAAEVLVCNLQREFVSDYIFPAIQGNALYEGRYLLGTSLARPLLARKQIEIAQEYQAAYVAHGATGKGNDQVRFELTYLALAPDIQIIAPWKDPEFIARFKGRIELLAYARETGIPLGALERKNYSMDENLMHKSYESGMLEDPAQVPDKEMFELTVDPEDAPDQPTLLDVFFKDGIPIRVENLNTGHSETEPLALFKYLNAVGGENGVGRLDIVENRYVGIKSRGVYETPAGTILHVAHQDIEGIAMDREVLRLRNMLSPKFAEVIYNGFWYSPEMDFLMAAVRQSQQLIDGRVRLKIYKGGVYPVGRESPNSLYNQDLSSMDIEGGFDQTDARGFINISSLRLKAHRTILRKQQETSPA